MDKQQQKNILYGRINDCKEGICAINNKEILSTITLQEAAEIANLRAMLADYEQQLEQIDWDSDDEVTITTFTPSPKQRKMAQIEAYDASTSVNEFMINGYGLWLTPAERGNFLNFLNAKLALGASDTDTITYILAGISITLTIADGLGMLAQIEVYAGDCAIVTGQHIAAVNALATDAEIEAYDYTVGYPAKLSYSL